MASFTELASKDPLRHFKVSHVSHSLSPRGSPLMHGPTPSHPQLMQRQQEGRTSSNQSILNLVNCLLGAGVLGYPFCFRSCGSVLASCIMLVSLAACRFSYQLLLYCSQLSTRRSYEEMAEQALGPNGRKIIEICTAALNMGALVAYLNILADVLSSVAGTIIPPGAEPSRSGYLAGGSSL